MSTMTLAPAVTTRRVYGRALRADGTPSLGHVEFFASLTYLDAEDNVTIVDSSVSGPVDPATGDWSVVVPVTDDPSLSPQIAAYAVRIPGARQPRTITVPTPAGSDTGDLRYVDAEDSVIVPAEMIGVALTGLTIGRVTTLPPGSLGTAELVGGAPSPELLLGIPQGPKGDRPVIQLGDVTTGPSGSAVQVTWTGVGSVAAPYVIGLRIPRGDRPTVTIGSITTGDPGTPAAATMTGTGATDDPYVISMTIPAGAAGTEGPPPAIQIGSVTTGTPAAATITGDGDVASPYKLNLVLPIGAGIDDATISTTKVWSSSKTRSLLLTPLAREIGPLRDCVIVGSSNAVPSTWTGSFCAAWGLVERNFAIAGSAFTNSNNFQSQLQTAAAASSFANSDVGMVIIADASNSIRANNDAGAWYSIATEADACFTYARNTFPNARIICLPVIWPADPSAQVAGVPGGYQRIWHAALRNQVDQIKAAARARGVEVVDQSWTWLTGLTGVMESSGGVHPNAAGYGLIAQWLSAYLRGESTRRDTPWVDVAYSNAKAIAGDRRLQVMREGWRVIVAGTGETTAASSGYTDFGTFPTGFRPVHSAELTVRQNGQVNSLAAILYEAGTFRLWQGVASGTQYFFTGGFMIG